MTEQKIQSQIIKYLKSIDYYVIKTISTTARGVPDIILCDRNGNFGAIEVKAKGKKHNTTKLQEYNIENIKNNNAVAIVADCVEDVKNMFK